MQRQYHAEPHPHMFNQSRTCRLSVVSWVQAVMERRSRREQADTSSDCRRGSAPGSQSGSDSSSALPRSSCDK